MALLSEGEKAVPPLDTGTVALEPIGTLAGDLLEVLTGLLIQRLDRVRGLLQRGEALGTQCPQPMALRGMGAARGGALQRQRRDQVVAQGLLAGRCEVERLHARVDPHEAVRIARYLWAMLLARLFEALPLVCPNGGANLRIIAFITEAAPVEQILLALGEPPRPPPISPARGPPAWDEAPEPAPDWDLVAQPEPEFDQRITW